MPSAAPATIIPVTALVLPLLSPGRDGDLGSARSGLRDPSRAGAPLGVVAVGLLRLGASGGDWSRDGPRAAADTTIEAADARPAP